jgi:glycosyltransferase involved in cell wall biosynthesis
LTSPSVSVVIPFHNGSTWIERALKSAASQTPPPKEIIVVDDGSIEAESAKLAVLKTKYSFEIYSQVNSGQSAARNLGVSRANSDFICFLDQDDYFLPNHIELLIDASNLEDEKFGFSYGDLLRVTESGETLSRSSLTSPHPLMDTHAMVSQNMHILPSATLIKRSAFLELGGFDESLQGYEDDDLFLRFHLAGYTAVFIPEPVSAWTINRSSTSFSESMSRSRFLYFKKLLDTFTNRAGFESDIFAKHLFPRFAYKFADDVIYSALNDKNNFEERKRRLKSFIQILKKDEGLNPETRQVYVLATWPLVFLAPSILRAALGTLLLLKPVLGKLELGLLKNFFDRH